MLLWTYYSCNWMTQNLEPSILTELHHGSNLDTNLFLRFIAWSSLIKKEFFKKAEVFRVLCSVLEEGKFGSISDSVQSLFCLPHIY